MSRSNAFEVKTKLSEQLLEDKRTMKKSKGLMIANLILFVPSIIGLILLALMDAGKIPTSIGGIGLIVLLILALSLSVIFLTVGIISIIGFCKYRRYYNWDLDAMEDDYKYLEDALGRDEAAEEELEKRRAKREAKERKRG